MICPQCRRSSPATAAFGPNGLCHCCLLDADLAAIDAKYDAHDWFRAAIEAGKAMDDRGGALMETMRQTPKTPL